MFLDLRNNWPPPEPWRPDPPRRLSPRGHTVLAWIIGFNVAMLLFGPFAGATLFDAVALLLR